MKFPQKQFKGFLIDHEVGNSRFPAGRDYDDEDELSNEECARWGFEQAKKQMLAKISEHTKDIVKRHNAIGTSHNCAEHNAEIDTLLWLKNELTDSFTAVKGLEGELK